jgi:hypothetical protein
MKGFSYTLEDDKILDYSKFSIEEKLEWLEEIKNFNELVLTEKDKQIRRKLLEAEI